MNFRISVYAFVLALAVSSCGKETGLQVIPRPQEVSVLEKTVPVGKELSCRILGSMGEEEYVLKVRRNGDYRIKAGGPAGAFYARTTIAAEAENGGVHPGRIHDFPRYDWRGFMLDEARHFSGEERVKFILDEMASVKMNKFHWHLSDAQGWRVEIKSYPKLTEVGAVGTHSDIHTPAQFYTQEQIRDIVAYADSLHIDIVPEIDMPGHASAACKAYPQYSGGGVSAGFPDFTFNVGKEETYVFLEGVLEEIADLFPGKYIMIGGDEVSYGSYAWLADKDIKALMDEKGYDNVLQAEGYFIRRISEVVRNLGKEMIGWDDIVDFDVPSEGNLMMWWRHDNVQRLHDVLDKGYTTILCPRKPMYFDFVQNDDHKVGRKWDGFCPIEDVYSFPDAYYRQWDVTESDLSGVIGIQSNLWSELTHNTDRVDFMVFPRIYATAESAWTMPQRKDYRDFSERLELKYEHMDSLGIYYYDYRNPGAHPEPEGPVILDRPIQKQDFKD